MNCVSIGYWLNLLQHREFSAAIERNLLSSYHLLFFPNYFSTKDGKIFSIDGVVI
jgi:hypothetical protein